MGQVPDFADILELTPAEYLCPNCGEWHEFPEVSISEMDKNYRDPVGECEQHRDYVRLHFDVNDGKFCFALHDCGYGGCNALGDYSWHQLKPEDFTVDADSCELDFETSFASRSAMSGCTRCAFCDDCYAYSLAKSKRSGTVKISLGLRFTEEDWDDTVEPFFTALQEAKEREKRKAAEPKPKARPPQQKTESVSPPANADDESVAAPDSESTIKNQAGTPNVVPPANAQKGDDAKMENQNQNLFGLKVEFGPNTDPNLVGTAMGVAVKADDNTFRIYKRDSGKITDVGNLQLGSFPVYIVPATKLTVGDLVKDAGSYYYVDKIEGGGRVHALHAKTSEVKIMVPTVNLLGFSVYSKVISLVDELGLGGGDFFGGDGGDKDQLLMLMALSGGMQNASPTTPAPNTGGMNGLMLPLLLMRKGKQDSDGSMRKLLLLSMLSGGSNSLSGDNLGLLLLMGGGDLFGSDNKRQPDITPPSYGGSENGN